MNQYKGILFPFICWIILNVMLQFFYSQAALMQWVNEHHSPLGDTFFSYLTHVGDGNTFILIALTVLLFISIKEGLILSIAFASSGIIAQVLKRFVFADSLRPMALLGNETWFKTIEGVKIHSTMSFPSGHTTSIFTLCVLLALLYCKPTLQWLLIAFAALGGFSRVYLNQHFPKDVLAGSLLGTCIAFLLYFFLKTKWNTLDVALIIRLRRKKNS
jgi:membrane-associated phospholipid phosphatase